MTAFAGIDYDTKAIHVVLLPEDGPPRYWSRRLEGFDAFERARSVRDVMPTRRTWDDWGVVAIGIEEQNSGNPKMRAMVQKLKVVQGAILACLPRETLVNPMAGPDWRKAVGLKGNATKETVRNFALGVQVLSGDELLRRSREWPQDACDAFCLALAVQRLTVPV